MTTYEERCRQAASDQGLDPVHDVLTREGFKPQFLQTGGFTMVLEAYSDPSILVHITQDSAGEEPYGDDPGSQPTYLICAVRPYTEEAGEEVEVAHQYGVSLEDVPNQVREYSLEVFTT